MSINKLNQISREKLASYEPTLQYYDSERDDLLKYVYSGAPGQVFIGKHPTPAQLKNIYEDLSSINLKIGFRGIPITLEDRIDFAATINEAMDAFYTKWNDILGCTERDVFSVLQTGVQPQDVFTWTTTKECVDITLLRNRIHSWCAEEGQRIVASPRPITFITDVFKQIGKNLENFAEGVKNIAPLVAGAAGGYALGKLLSSFGTSGGPASIGQSPSSQMMQFINTDVPSVIEAAFAMDGRQAEFAKLNSLALGEAKRMRKLITNRRADRDTAVASFGDVEIRLNGRVNQDMLLDAMVEAICYDACMLTFGCPTVPGSAEAYMLGDTYGIPMFQDAQMHRDWIDTLSSGVNTVLGWANSALNIYTAIKTPTSQGGSPPPQQQPQPQPQPQPVYQPPQPVYQPPQVAVAPPSYYQTQYEPPAAAPVPGNVITIDLDKLPGWATSVVKLAQVVGLVPQSSAEPVYGMTRFGTPIGVLTAINGRNVVVPVSDSPELQAKAYNMINRFLSSPSLFNSSLKPFTTPQPMFSARQVAVFQDSRVGLGSTRSRDTVPFLSKKPAVAYARGPLNDAICGSIFDRPDGNVPRGEFYRSGMLIGELADLPSKVYGQINVSQMPYRIQINRNMVDSRAKVSFVHETLHAITELLKLGLSHEQLHALSIFITSEVLPGYLALENKLRS